MKNIALFYIYLNRKEGIDRSAIHCSSPSINIPMNHWTINWYQNVLSFVFFLRSYTSTDKNFKALIIMHDCFQNWTTKLSTMAVKNFARRGDNKEPQNTRAVRRGKLSSTVSLQARDKNWSALWFMVEVWTFCCCPRGREKVDLSTPIINYSKSRNYFSNFQRLQTRICLRQWQWRALQIFHACF